MHHVSYPGGRRREIVPHVDLGLFCEASNALTHTQPRIIEHRYCSNGIGDCLLPSNQVCQISGALTGKQPCRDHTVTCSITRRLHWGLSSRPALCYMRGRVSAAVNRELITIAQAKQILTVAYLRAQASPDLPDPHHWTPCQQLPLQDERALGLLAPASLCRQHVPCFPPLSLNRQRRPSLLPARPHC